MAEVLGKTADDRRAEALQSKIGTLSLDAQAKLEKDTAKKEAKAVNATTVSVEAAFMASADDLFSILTDEKRIPAWTRAPAKVRCQPLWTQNPQCAKRRAVCCPA